jgi:hypothetical protein
MTPTDPVEARLIASLHAPLTDARAGSLRERVQAAVARPITTGGRGLARPRRRTVVGTFIAAALLVASAATAQRVLYPDRPYPALEAALADAFAGMDCVGPAAARRTVRAQLDGLGYDDWTIGNRAGAASARCVSTAVNGRYHEVMLLPAAGGDLIAALDVVRTELLDRCLGRDDAIRLVRSVLVSMHVTDEWQVRANPDGPQGAPADQWDAYKKHVADGCYVLAGTGNHGYVDLWGP